MEQINPQEVEDTKMVSSPAKSRQSAPKLSFFSLVLILVGVLGITGGVLFAKSRLGNSSVANGVSTDTSIPTDQGSIKMGTVYGSKDESNFPDKAEGVVVAGGVSGEGSHHLVRVGGASQNVYLSSSVVDLDTVIGARVQVWGQTQSAKKAGWLMDVGRLKVLELNAPQPE